MSFPIQFADPSHHNFFSPFINFGSNGAIVVGGIGLVVIARVALKALGFSKPATVAATAVPATIGVTGVVCIIASVCMLTYMFATVAISLMKR